MSNLFTPESAIAFITGLVAGLLTAFCFVYRYFRIRKKNIGQLRKFASMAEKNEDVMSADITFPDNELGEISGDIVRLYAKLQNSEDDKTMLKRQLTQNIAHELRTPVSSMKGYLETLENEPDMSPEVRKLFISRSRAQSERLSALIEDISLLSKVEDASRSFELEDVKVADILQNIYQDSRKKLEDRKMKFLMLVDYETKVRSNPQLLYSIFRNLTDNAIAYAGEGVTVTVRVVREDESKYYFSFSDNGAGVPEEALPHLFERFYRVDKGRSRKSGGTGLGLAIVKNAIMLHGGKISVSLAPTGGLEFNFTLPK